MTKQVALLTAATLVALAASLPAGSIWDKSRASAGSSLVSDDTARAVGDTLTIAILEKSVIANETKRDMNKKDERNASADIDAGQLKIGTGTTNNIFSLKNMSAKTSGETKFTGDAKFDSKVSVTDRVTVTVQDVLPNGNLVVMGSRQRDMHGDVEVIEISGVVRPSDIDFTNLVLSEKVADFNVVYRHKGQENQFTKPGWLGRVLNILSPY